MTVLIGRMEHETSLGIEGATAGMQLTQYKWDDHWENAG
jgi:hypothetical protein